MNQRADGWIILTGTECGSTALGQYSYPVLPKFSKHLGATSKLEAPEK